MDYNLNGAWRDTGRESKLWIFNSSTTFPLLACLFHIKWWTFITAVAVMAFFTVLSYFGLNIYVFSRLVRSTLAGKRKIATPWWLA